MKNETKVRRLMEPDLQPQVKENVAGKSPRYGKRGPRIRVPVSAGGSPDCALCSRRCIPHRTRVARKTARRPRRRPQNKPTAVRVCSLFAGWRNERDWQRRWNGWHTRGLDVDKHTPFPRSAMSSKLPSILSATDEEIQLLLAAQSHIGSKNVDKQMLPYVWKRRSDGQ